MSTCQVIDWLTAQNIEHVVVYPDSYISNLKLKITSMGIGLSLTINDKLIDLSEIDSFWHRRGFFNQQFRLLSEQNSIHKSVNRHLRSEWLTVSEMINAILESKPSIGSSIIEQRSNKLLNLKAAQECGLLIPDTCIISSKKELQKLKNNMSLTKSINRDIQHFETEKDAQQRVEFANFGPMLLEDENIQIMGETFWPSLLQNTVSKKYELRIFILHSSFYSMAIFSQNDPTTALDGRTPNFERPTRQTPYSLPQDVRVKLLNYMKQTNQNCASVDMIVNDNGDYVFLESNPVGQFGYVSYICNYHLEYELARMLAENTQLENQKN